jgi:hypothetical protein
MTALLVQAFTALGMGPSMTETALVASALRASGDRATLALFEGDTKAAMERLEAVAVEAGSCGLVALDLLTEVVNPGVHERVLARGRPVPDEARPSELRST